MAGWWCEWVEEGCPCGRSIRPLQTRRWPNRLSRRLLFGPRKVEAKQRPSQWTAPPHVVETSTFFLVCTVRLGREPASPLPSGACARMFAGTEQRLSSAQLQRPTHSAQRGKCAEAAATVLTAGQPPLIWHPNVS